MSETTFYHCRLCLNYFEFCYSLFDEDVVQIIESFCPIKITENEHLSSHCCPGCLEEVYLVEKIRSRIIESDRILHEENEQLKSDVWESKFNPEDPIVETSCEFTLNQQAKQGYYKDTLLNTKVTRTEQYVLDNENNSTNTIENIATDFTDTIDNNFKEEIPNDVDANCKIVMVYDAIDTKLDIEEKIIILGGDILNQQTLQRKQEFRLNKKKSRLICEPCEKKFPSQHQYNAHLKLCRKSKFTACKICSAQISTANLSKHMSIHTSGPKSCEICGKQYKNSESLRGHMFYVHTCTEEKYKCSQCEKTFRIKYRMQCHKRKEHGGEPSHICEVCAKAFYTKYAVLNHVRKTHLKLRPYPCQYCGKKFSSSNARNTHTRQHTGEEPYKCEICFLGFRQRVSLKTHMKSKHKITVPLT